MRDGSEAMSERITGLKLKCTVQEWKRCPGSFVHAGIDVGLRAQHELIGIEAVGPLATDAVGLGPTQARLHRADH